MYFIFINIGNKPYLFRLVVKSLGSAQTSASVR